MKARFLVTIPALALAFASGFACSSSSNNHHGTGGSGGTAGSGGSAGTGGTAGSGGTAGTGGAAGDGGQLKDQCTSASDMAAIHADYDGGLGVTEIATNCGKGCLGNTDREKCTKDCIAAATGNAISDGCMVCFIQSFNCGVNNCLSPCLGTQAECNACLCTKGCLADFATCSGDPTATCGCADAGTAPACQTDGGAGAGGGGAGGTDAGGG